MCTVGGQLRGAAGFAPEDTPMAEIRHDFAAEARAAAARLGVDFAKERFTVGDLARGIAVEYEHGRAISAAKCGHPDTNVTDDDLLATARIALAHLYETRERPGEDESVGGVLRPRCGEDTQFDYYDGLALVETAPVGYWRGTAPARYWRDKTLGFGVLVVVMVAVVVALAAARRPAAGGRTLQLLLLGALAGLGYVAATWK